MLAVGACSSGNDDGLTAERDDALTAQKAALAAQAAAEADATAARAEATAALAAQMAAEADRDAALAAQMTAEMDAATAVTARMAAETAAEAALAAQMTAEMDAATAETARMEAVAAAATAETARMEAVAAAATAETARMEAVTAQMTAEQERDDAIKRADDAEAEVARVNLIAADVLAEKASEDASDMAKAVLAAIKANTVSEDLDPASDAVKFTASSGGDLTATLAGYTMSAAPEEIADWRGRTLENDDGDTTVIYTNIENAEAKTIGSLYRAASDPGELTVHYSVLNELDSNMNKDILWADAKRTNEDSGVTGTGEEAVTTFAGSVRGLAGTFSCTGTCTIPAVPDEGTDLTAGAGPWTFTPTDPKGTIDVPNPDYVSFGWWLNAMGTEGAYEFDAFASVSESLVANTGSGGNLEDSATYKGGAAGKYAMQSTTDDSASGGHFTATATLRANFDVSTVADNPAANEDGVSIGGTINNFMTGDVSRPNWKVTLSYDNDIDNVGVQPLETLGPISDGATTKWATGGAVDGVGTWSANFHGSEKDTAHPTAVAGEFNAAIGGDDDIARISGAFAATKQ